MRKGFTMIELIFVIVILGVLASVAIPRLAATRDDAEIAKAATNITTAISDITAYYTAKGEFDSDTKNMTNALETGGKLKVKSADCATITPSGGTGTDAAKITLKITGTDTACSKLKELSGIKSMCKDNVNNCEITVGGSNVSF